MVQFKINEDFVNIFFEKRGYKIIKIFFTGRSFVGAVKKDNKKFFFKFAKNEEVTRRLRNEHIWYKKLNPPSIKNNWPVYIPKIYDKGIVHNSFWFICDYFNSENILADPDKRFIIPNYVNKYLNKTIDFLFIMRKLKIKLPNDTDETFYFQKYKDPKLFNKSSLINVCKQIGYNPKKIFEKKELSYTDYKPWHFFKYKNKVALVDAENANNITPKYYDIASYYTRMITILNREDIARTLLKRYIARLSEDKEEFMKKFRAIVGWISLGELNDAKRKKKLSKGNYEIFKKFKKNSFLD